MSGKERSREPGRHYSWDSNLGADGVVEVWCLTKCQFPRKKLRKSPFPLGPAFLEKVAAIDGLKRVRFMTSHPKGFIGWFNSCDQGKSKDLSTFAFYLSIGEYGHFKEDEPRLYKGKLPGFSLQKIQRNSRDEFDHRHYCWISWWEWRGFWGYPPMWLER